MVNSKPSLCSSFLRRLLLLPLAMASFNLEPDDNPSVSSKSASSDNPSTSFAAAGSYSTAEPIPPPLASSTEDPSPSMSNPASSRTSLLDLPPEPARTQHKSLEELASNIFTAVWDLPDREDSTSLVTSSSSSSSSSQTLVGCRFCRWFFGRHVILACFRCRMGHTTRVALRRYKGARVFFLCRVCLLGFQIRRHRPKTHLLPAHSLVLKRLRYLGRRNYYGLALRRMVVLPLQKSLLRLMYMYGNGASY